MARDEYFANGRSMIPKSGYLFSGKTIFREFQPCPTERGTGHAHLHSEAATMERALFTACLHAALARLRTRANDWPMKRGRRKHRPQFDQRVGKEGQLSNPEQNEMVAEAAGPSQHLLPASSKAASGTSKLSVSSSKSAVIDSVMMDHPFLRPIKDNKDVSNRFIGVSAGWHWRQIVDRYRWAWRRNALRDRVFGQSNSSRHIPASVAAFFASSGSGLSLRRGGR